MVYLGMEAGAVKTADDQFLNQADQIYSEAFDEARAEINAAAKAPVGENSSGASFDMRT